MRKRILILTPGDPSGIGPEIAWKAIRAGICPAAFSLLCIGAAAPFKKLKAPIVEFDPTAPLNPPKSRRPYVWLFPAPEQTPPSEVGVERFLEGYQAGWSIEQATRMVLEGFASALVTGPIHKERLQRGGYAYPGHTEFLAALCNKALGVAGSTSVATRVPTMMLANSLLRVVLVTTHLSLQGVSAALTPEKLNRTVLNTVRGLRDFWGIKSPKIAVAALNPHAGESGLFGREEQDLIIPAVERLRKAGVDGSDSPFEISGPYSADTLFARHILLPRKKRYDAVVCMYHDQGLIPVKLLDFHHTVNVTLGLPIIRTSVDHGVGFDIAGKGIANPSSLCAAITLAAHLTKKRHGSK